jgi:hypothetical protein
MDGLLTNHLSMPGRLLKYPASTSTPQGCDALSAWQLNDLNRPPPVRGADTITEGLFTEPPRDSWKPFDLIHASSVVA